MVGWRTAHGGFLTAFLAVAAAVAAIPSVPAESTTPLPSKAKASGSQMLTAPVLTTSSAVFPIHGDVYPQGLYYVEMNIGDPPKPYFLDIDTGSDLTWIQCDAPCVRCPKGPHPLYRPRKNNLVPPTDPLCAALHPGSPQDPSSHQCDYEIHYQDRGSSLGVLVADAFSLHLANTTTARPVVLAFGCGYDQQFAGQNATTPTDGVLGLRTGKVSVPSQLSDHGVTRDVMGHCLSEKGGYLFFGGDLVPSSGMTWMPMSRIESRNYYSPGPANLYWGNQSLGVKQMEVVLDTGSTFTYFELQPYQALLSAVKSDLSKTPLKEVLDPSLPVCWRGQKPFESVDDVKKYFKTLALYFVNGKNASLEVPPENYLIITEHGNTCLGILDGTRVGLDDLNIIGDISLQDLLVVYDNEKQKIGWVGAACDRLPKSGTSSP